MFGSSANRSAFVFAFANAVLFTAYIVLAHRVARHAGISGVDGLAAAMLFAFVFVSPIGLADATHAVTDPVALAAGVGVGVSSSVIHMSSISSRWRRFPARRTRSASRFYRRRRS